MNIAVIPARGGSKRIPGKNIKHFIDQPIIAYSIQAAINSAVFDRVIVSTDSEEIAEIARSYHAEAPFLRPDALANDDTPTAPVITHVLEWLLAQGVALEYACCIYATAPFVQAKYLVQGREIMRQTHCATCYSVTTFPFPILRGLRINDADCLEMLWPEHEMTRSQDLSAAYHDAGQFYWLDCAQFLKQPKLYAADSRPVLIPRHFVQDIDTLEDWTRAEYMYQAWASAADQGEAE